MQAKLQEEVDRAFEEAEGEFPDYTVVQGLPYLDMVVHETLRLHSPAPTTFRYCTHHHHHQPSSSTINHNVLHPQVVHAGLHHPRHQHHPQEERQCDVQREGLAQGPPVSGDHLGGRAEHLSRHYSHPDHFHPDHFSKEEKAARSP